jgi:hypothetical protein
LSKRLGSKKKDENGNHRCQSSYIPFHFVLLSVVNFYSIFQLTVKSGAAMVFTDFN